MRKRFIFLVTLIILGLSASFGFDSFIGNGVDMKSGKDHTFSNWTDVVLKPGDNPDDVDWRIKVNEMVSYQPSTKRPPTNDLTFDRLKLLDDVAIWQRENEFVGQTNSLRLNFAPIPAGNHIDSPEDISSEATRVLLIGDSFVSGFGLNDTDRVWHRLLSAEMQRRNYPGSYRIIPIAQGNLSFISYTEVLSKDTINAYKPDIIMIGMLPNDWYPSGNERQICGDKISPLFRQCPIGDWFTTPEYLSCIQGGDGLFGSLVSRIIRPLSANLASKLLTRYCNEERLSGSALVYEKPLTEPDPKNNPYMDVFKDSISTLKENAGEIPVIIMPTYPVNMSIELLAPYLKLLREAGFIIAKTEATERLYGNDNIYDARRKELWINPADPHPGGELSLVYSLDAADALSAHTKPKGRVVPLSEMKLMSNYSPSTMMHVSDSANRSSIMFDPSWSIIKKWPSVANLSGFTTPTQDVACAPFGRPHALMTLNPERLAETQRVKITLNDTDADGFVLSQITYNNIGKRIVGKVMPIVAGESIILNMDVNTASFMLGSVKNGCPLDKVITLPKFSLSVEALPRV